MLVEFSFGNFLSFKDKVTFSMVGAGIRENPENIVEKNNIKLLKSAAIFGANASGKSNILKAFQYMKYFVLHSLAAVQAGDLIRGMRFKLDKAGSEQPAFFEVVIDVNGEKYRYGFTVNSRAVESEWLFRILDTGREKDLFVREKEITISGDFLEGKGLEDKTRENALFLSVVTQFNGTTSSKILNWFNSILFFKPMDHMFERKEIFENKIDKKKVIKLLQCADSNICDLKFKQRNVDLDKIPFPQDMPESVRNDLLSEIRLEEAFIRKDLDGNSVEFDFSEESLGTQRMYAMAGPVIKALERGETMFVDELEASLHPLLTSAIVKMFNSENNTNGAQLIFTTHNSKLLDREFFRRDQLWFVEKSKNGSSSLFSLVEFKQNDAKIRKDASYAKDYLAGRYGAIPMLDTEIEKIISKFGDDNGETMGA